MPSVNLKRMRFISVMWGMVMFAIVVALTTYGFFYKNQAKEYKSLETLLESKSQEYIEKEGIIVDDKLKISKEDLMSKNYIDTLEVKNQTCEGYVIITKNSDKFKYNAFINCGKYKTKNYNKNS